MVKREKLVNAERPVHKAHRVYVVLRVKKENVETKALRDCRVYRANVDFKAFRDFKENLEIPVQEGHKVFKANAEKKVKPDQKAIKVIRVILDR